MTAVVAIATIDRNQRSSEFLTTGRTCRISSRKYRLKLRLNSSMKMLTTAST